MRELGKMGEKVTVFDYKLVRELVDCRSYSLTKGKLNRKSNKTS